MKRAWIAAIGFLMLANSAIAAIPLQINHQGVVKVSGVAFDGNGDFYFAFIGGSSGNNLWTNDGSQLGTNSQPASAVTLSVTQGLYSVNLGDTSLANMVAIPSTVFNADDVKLRIWFDDGSGTVQLSPDLSMTSSPYAFQAASAVESTTSAVALDAQQLGGIGPSGYATDGELSSGLAGKANSADVYTQTEIDNSLSGKSDTGHGHNLQDLSGAVTDAQVPDDITIATASYSILSSTADFAMNAALIGGVSPEDYTTDAELVSGLSGKSDTGHGHNLQDLSGAVTDAQVPDDITITETDTLDTVTGRGASTTNDITISTVNTGQGANELYAMDQDVKTNDDVIFNSVGAAAGTFTGDVTATTFHGDGSNLTGLDPTVDKNEINNSGALGFQWSDAEVSDNLTVTGMATLTGTETLTNKTLTDPTVNAEGGSVVLPQGTDVSGNTAEGQVSWDSDDDKLYVGNGSAVVEIGAGGGGGTKDTITVFSNSNWSTGAVYHAIKIPWSGTITGFQTYCYTDSGATMDVRINGTSALTSSIDFTNETIVEGTVKSNGDEVFSAGDTISFYFAGGGTAVSPGFTLFVTYD